MAIIGDRQPPRVTESGIVIGAYASSAGGEFDVELQRAMGSSTGTFVQIGRTSPARIGETLQFTDWAPNDNVTRCYRARHVRDGYTAGAYTAIVKGKPETMTVTRQPMLELSGRSVTSDIRISTSATVRFGDATQSYVRKQYMFGAAEFNPLTSTYNSYRLQSGYLTVDTVGGPASTQIQTFRVSFGFPVGAVLRGASARLWISSTVGAGRILLTVNRYSSATSTAIQIGTAGWGITSGSTLAVNTWHTVSSTAFTHTVSTPYTNYDVSVAARAGSGTQRIPRFQWALVEVDIPSLDVAR